MTTNHLENEPAVRERSPSRRRSRSARPSRWASPIGRYGPLTRNPVVPTLYRGRFGAAWTP